MESCCKPPKGLDLNGNISENWSEFKQSFDIFLKASGNIEKSDEIKVAILLSIVGEDGNKLYNTFNLQETDKDNLTKVMQCFEEYCIPKKNIVYETFKFFNRIQKEDENFESFLTEIKNLSQTCEFGTLTDRMVRDRIVLGIKDKVLQERLLSIEDLDLNKAIDYCKAAEVSKTPAKNLQENKVEVDSKDKGEAENCKRCGTKHGPECPAYGKKCDTYINALEVCEQFLHESNYESSKQMGRGHRIKKKSKRFDSSSEENEANEANEHHVKGGNNSKIPPPPRLRFKGMTLKCESRNLKRNASSRIETVDSTRDKKVSNIFQHSPCHSVSSHEENTDIDDTVEGNISENSNVSHKSMEGFDVKSEVNLFSLEKKVREVSSKLDIVIINQERLNRCIMPGEKVVKRPNKLPPLPLRTETELIEMEQFLSEENNLSATCAYMSRYVNLEKVKASAFRILRNLMTNSLAKQFSFQGSGTKHAFRTSKLYSVVEGAFIFKEEKFNLTLVESATSVWLINAAWRKQEDGSSRRSNTLDIKSNENLDLTLSSNENYIWKEELI